MSIEARLVELGIELPDLSTEEPEYFVRGVEWNGCLYLSGHGPMRAGEPLYRGKVDSVVSVESARQAAELTMRCILASARQKLGTLDRVAQAVKVLGMVNSDPAFVGQPSVIDAASDLLIKVFGASGRHARSAVGVASLPYGIPVEIEVIFAIS